jgi:ribosomal-protein-alanine N-acetyltransferase
MIETLVHTERLELAPLSLEAIEALLQGDAARLRELTGATFPRPVAPPPYRAEALPVVRDRLRAQPDEAPWWNWVIVERGTRRAIGSVAFGGEPDASGSVLIGYAMYPAFEGLGYATEAVRAMIGWAFHQPGVKLVRALAPVWNTPARRVAENVGKRPVASEHDYDNAELLDNAVSEPQTDGSA